MSRIEVHVRAEARHVREQPANLHLRLSARGGRIRVEQLVVDVRVLTGIIARFVGVHVANDRVYLHVKILRIVVVPVRVPRRAGRLQRKLDARSFRERTKLHVPEIVSVARSIRREINPRPVHTVGRVDRTYRSRRAQRRSLGVDPQVFPGIEFAGCRVRGCVAHPRDRLERFDVRPVIRAVIRVPNRSRRERSFDGIEHDRARRELAEIDVPQTARAVVSVSGERRRSPVRPAVHTPHHARRSGRAERA